MKYVLWFSVIRAENPIPRMVGDGPADDKHAQGRFKTQLHQHDQDILQNGDLKHSGVVDNQKTWE